MSEQFDLIVLGSGSGGLSAAQHAARLGARVAMFDPDLLGGTCVNRGCVPKKAMWFAAHMVTMQRLAADYGFDAPPLRLDWAQFRQKRETFIAGIRERYDEKLKAAGIQVIREAAYFVAADSVETSLGKSASAPQIVIATGARPRRMDISGFELGMLSDDVFALDAAPGRIAIVGGGYVAAEFACVLHTLGCEVEMLLRGNFLPEFEPDLTAELATQMQARGIRMVNDVNVIAARGKPGTISLETSAGKTFGDYNAVLWAVGRVPNSDTLRLDTVGLAHDAQGHILVDAYQNTGVAGISAVGDVTNQKALTPVAVAAGRALAERLFGRDNDAHMDVEAIPSVVFTEPPLGIVGLTEQQARMQHGESVRVHEGRYIALQWRVAGRNELSLVKVVCVGDEQRVVGIHVLGAGSEELLQGFAVAMRHGLRYRDLRQAIAIHPTAAEELVLLP